MSILSDYVDKYITPNTAKIGASMRAAADSANFPSRALVSLSVALHPHALLFGTSRYRKPYIKQPGEQFAVFAEGRLTQFKRLTDGSVVKV